jgi:hypothetical protein
MAVLFVACLLLTWDYSGGMKIFYILAGLLFAVVRSTLAQVDVEIIMPQDQFLPNENIPVRVRIINHAAETLSFDTTDWLSYAVEARNGEIMEKAPRVVAPHGFEIKAGEMATTRAEVSPHFQLAKTGRYSISTTVTIKEWGKTFASKAVFFDLVHGNTIWSQDFGVPQSTNSTAAPEVRKYALVQATLKNQLNLYLRLTDTTEEKIYLLKQLGVMMSFSNPKGLTDSYNFLHVLYQSASRQYRYMVIDPNGEIILRNTYAYTESAPHMKVEQDGSVSLLGGARLVAENDIPSKDPSKPENEIPEKKH